MRVNKEIKGNASNWYVEEESEDVVYKTYNSFSPKYLYENQWPNKDEELRKQIAKDNLDRYINKINHG